MFAKLFGTDDNQVLVKLDTGNDGPEIRFFFKPPGLGVCSLALDFQDADGGWDRAEAAFANIDEAAAIKMTERVLNNLEVLGEEPDLNSAFDANGKCTWGSKKDFCEIEARAYFADDVPITENPYFENTWPWKWFNDEYMRLCS